MQAPRSKAALLVLPIHGQHHVCRVSDAGVSPVAMFPCAADARLFRDADGQRIAVIDQSDKRAGLYELLPDAPWLRVLVKPRALPAGSRGHAALGLADSLLVGGHSPSGEALWQRFELGDAGEWTCIPIPEALRRRGKAVDGLHIDGDRLIAVDDIRVPKWIFLYRIQAGGTLTMDRPIALPTHTTYERILDSSLGQRTLWLVSRGVNHGRVGGYVWGLDRRSFKPVVCWSAVETSEDWLVGISPWLDRTPVVPEPPPGLAKAVGVTEWRNALWVACGESGLYRISLLGSRAEWVAAKPVAVEGVRLGEVNVLVPSPAQDCPGLFLLGSSIEGYVDHQFLPARALGWD